MAGLIQLQHRRGWPWQPLSPRSLKGLSGPRSVAFEGGGALAGSVPPRGRWVPGGSGMALVAAGRPQRPLLAALVWGGQRAAPVIALWRLTAPSAAVADGAEQVSVVGDGALPSSLGTAPDVRVRVEPLAAVRAAMQASEAARATPVKGVAAVAGSVRTPVWDVLLCGRPVGKCTSIESQCAACVGTRGCASGVRRTVATGLSHK